MQGAYTVTHMYTRIYIYTVLYLCIYIERYMCIHIYICHYASNKIYIYIYGATSLKERPPCPRFKTSCPLTGRPRVAPHGGPESWGHGRSVGSSRVIYHVRYIMYHMLYTRL